MALPHRLAELLTSALQTGPGLGSPLELLVAGGTTVELATATVLALLGPVPLVPHSLLGVPALLGLPASLTELCLPFLLGPSGVLPALLAGLTLSTFLPLWLPGLLFPPFTVPSLAGRFAVPTRRLGPLLLSLLAPGLRGPLLPPTLLASFTPLARFAPLSVLS